MQLGANSLAVSALSGLAIQPVHSKPNTGAALASGALADLAARPWGGLSSHRQADVLSAAQNKGDSEARTVPIKPASRTLRL